jgi:cell division protein FtsN
MSHSWEPLPSIYRSKQEFLASLPPWRRLLQKLNWRPTVDLKVRRYALEQRLLQMQNEDEQLRKEDEQLAALDARQSAVVSSSSTSSSTSSSPPPSTHENPGCDRPAGGVRPVLKA